MGIHSLYARDIVLGALVGAFIAAFLASIEALSVSQNRLALRGIRTGGFIGAIGGAVGLIVAELAFDVMPGFFGRILGWSVLGIAVGLGVGWATGSNARRRNGALGGVVGGALGGLFYQSLTTTFPQAFGRAIAIIILGDADRLLHRTRQRALQARMADGGPQPEPQRARGPRVSARQAGHDHRSRGGMRRRAVRRPERAWTSCDHPARGQRTTRSRQPAAAR